MRKPIVAIVVALTALVQQQPPVVNNPAPNFVAASFSLAARPTLTIDGNVSGDSLQELFNVGAMTLTPNGSLIVVNNRGESVREYDRAGRFLRTISRKGAGPGEYRAIADMRVLDGDTLVFWDPAQRRITLLGPDRRPVRTITGLRSAVCCSMHGAFADHGSGPSPVGGVSWSPGSLPYAFGSIRSGRGPQEGIAFAPDSAPQVPLPGYTAGVTIMMQEGKPSPVWVTYDMPFTIQPLARFGADELIVATGERFEYRVYDQTGKLIRVVRAAAPTRPVTAAMSAALRSKWAKPSPRFPGYAERRVAALDTLDLPENLPAYDRLFVEEDGTVWLRDYVVADSLPTAWARFDRQGKLLGTIVLPANLTPRFSRGQAIVTVRDTAADFQRVMVYPIVRK